MNQPICDFCSEPAPAWCYPAATFIALSIGPIESASEGGWAACEDCHRLIEAGDRVGLAERSAALLVVANPEFASAGAELRADLGRLHAGFFAHRRGPCVPISVANAPKSAA